MIIFVIDDEEMQLKSAKRILNNVEPEATVMLFSKVSDLLSSIKKEEIIPDIVFSDIEMPEMTGIELAMKIKKLTPEAHIIFVTAYSEYAVDAFKIRAKGYLMKPITAKDVREELDNIPELQKLEGNKLKVKCFGHFEVFYQGQPLIFQRKQTKELLAFLIDQEGVLSTSEEICAAMWGDEANMSTINQRIRNLISDMRSTLSEIGMEKVLIREHRQVAINKEMLDCDYYRMLEGDMAAINAFKGEYMIDYAWAEYTAANLTFSDI